MERVGRRTVRKVRSAPAGRWVAGAVAVLALAGLVAAVILGAPLVSILIIGVLLLCPLLLWVPLRFERRSLDESTPERRGYCTHA